MQAMHQTRLGLIHCADGARMSESMLGQKLAEASASITDRETRKPRVALVLGSGLGNYADTLQSAAILPYATIPHMMVSSVSGHAGNLVIGHKGEQVVVAMQGRTHLYEGHSPHEVVFGVRLMATLGADTLIVTNAAGGANPDFAVGDLMVIEDHLNLTGTSSLVGPNDDALGPRFPDMSQAYDAELGDVARARARANGFELQGGIYAGLLGPAYETPAEVDMLRRLGADAVGMSTVLEVIAARHMGMRVLGISCITNKAAGLSDQPLDHAEVKETAAMVNERFIALLDGIIANL